MALPAPQPGLVIRYSYLWRREAIAGRDEGAKDRPSVIVLAVQTADGSKVYVLPITHAAPALPEDGVEIPLPVKRRLGLDGERSWIMLTEANVFSWPGPDLRAPPGRASDAVAFGFLPPALFRLVRDRFLARIQAQRSRITPRTE